MIEMIEVLWNKVVFGDGRHNAWTDLAYYRGRYYLVFRRATAHVSRDGRIFLMMSVDGEKWSDLTLLPGTDGIWVNCADPRFYLFKDRLFCTFPAHFSRDERDPYHFVSYSTHTEDGISWSPPKHCYSVDWCLWRAKEWEGVLYGAFYNGEGFHEDLWRVALLKSGDGVGWEYVSTVYEGAQASEPEIHFQEDGEALMVIRRGLANAVLARSKPPYKRWTRSDLGAVIHSAAIAKVGTKLIMAGREVHRCWGDENASHVVIWEFDGSKFNKGVTLGIGGDSAYPGIQPMQDKPHEALVSYYLGKHLPGSTPAKSDIWIAKIGIS